MKSVSPLQFLFFFYAFLCFFSFLLSIILTILNLIVPTQKQIPAVNCCTGITSELIVVIFKKANAEGLWHQHLRTKHAVAMITYKSMRQQVLKKLIRVCYLLEGSQSLSTTKNFIFYLHVIMHDFSEMKYFAYDQSKLNNIFNSF